MHIHTNIPPSIHTISSNPLPPFLTLEQRLGAHRGVERETEVDLVGQIGGAEQRGRHGDIARDFHGIQPKGSDLIGVRALKARRLADGGAAPRDT